MKLKITNANILNNYPLRYLKSNKKFQKTRLIFNYNVCVAFAYTPTMINSIFSSKQISTPVPKKYLQRSEFEPNTSLHQIATRFLGKCNFVAEKLSYLRRSCYYFSFILTKTGLRKLCIASIRFSHVLRIN